MDSKDWTGRTDGTDWMLRSLIWFFRWMPPRVLYAVMGLVVPFYMLLRRKSFLAIYHYYRQGHGCGRLRAFVNVYRNHYAFGQVILDRFAVYAGRRFSLEIEGNEYYKRIADQPGGAVFLSSHTGNFELCGYLLNSVGKHLHALVYAGEAEAVMENRRRVWAAHNVTMVPVRDDLSHLFAINAALEEGDAVCMAGDRLLGSAKSVVCPFLGRPARFPLGPYALAVQHGVPLVALFVMKESASRYHVYVQPVRLTAEEEALPRRQRMEALARAFAAQMERIVKQYPHQWFNYYDFWNTGSARP